jgi:uncharacterized repeat protein (TIGR03803 family)
MAMRLTHILFAATLFALLTSMTFAQTKNFIALHQFVGGQDGAFPEGAVVLDKAGNLYGTTALAGGGATGTVYKINTKGVERVLFRFQIAKGTGPASPLVLDKAGNLYGIANSGPDGGGVIFKVSPNGKQTLLHAFTNTTFGPKTPSGGILMEKSGNIFGTTAFGGSRNCQAGCGIVFRLNTAGTLSVLHRFNGADGNQPSGPLVQDSDGNLYGVAQFGGDLACQDPQVGGKGCGTVFKLSKKGIVTVLHTFEGGSDGAIPQAGLLLDSAGNVYGATAHGGDFENGTIFQISHDGTYAVRYRFTGASDGMTPNGGLVMDASGNLLGTAQAGGQGFGTIFKLTPTGTLTVVHSFTGQEDGAFPLAGLIHDDVGHFFGTAFRNFLSQTVQGGNVFEVRP